MSRTQARQQSFAIESLKGNGVASYGGDPLPTKLSPWALSARHEAHE